MGKGQKTKDDRCDAGVTRIHCYNSSEKRCEQFLPQFSLLNCPKHWRNSLNSMPAPMNSPSAAVPPAATPSSGPKSPNKNRRTSKQLSPRKSVASSAKMDGSKMSELATIKLKQMDKMTKKMKENYKLSQEQIETGEGK